MCGLFGFVDAGHKLSRKQRSMILTALANASEARGTDATGIAYNAGGKLTVYKRPVPAHLMWFRVPIDAAIVTGHTRAATQGSQLNNCNNHPFTGKAGGISFALAHNGVLVNDKSLRRRLKLPNSQIETDSYVGVQLIELQEVLSFASLGYMAEHLEGSYTFTVLSDKDELYIVKGDNPLCMYYYKDLNLYLYASTGDILKAALKQIPFKLGIHEKISLVSGEILRIDSKGKRTQSWFDDKNLYDTMCFPWLQWLSRYPAPRELSEEEEYIADLKAVAPYYGFYEGDVDALLADGFSISDIEEILYGG